MGMFDSVFVNCPTCNDPQEIQTKEGKCELGRYTIATAPHLILLALADEQQHCKNGHLFYIQVQSIVMGRLVPGSPYDDDNV